MTRLHPVALLSAVLGLTSAAGTPATARAADAGLEEVVVTAQRREQNLQETPVTVTAITPQQLQDLAIENTRDLAKAVPNLQLLPVTANPSTFQIGLRGGSEQTSGLIVSEPVVGLYVDDVYRGRLQGANFQLADVERIEVLRGPQGTLYGRNTFSGALKIVTRTPSPENEWFDAAVGRGSHDEWNAQVSAGGGIGEVLGASVSALWRDQRDGWIFNRAQNRTLGAEDNVALRGKLALESGPWSAVLSASWGRDRNDGYIPAAIRYVPAGRPIPQGPATQVSTDDVRPRFGDDAYVTEFPQPSLGRTETTTATLNVAYEIGASTLRSITGWVDLEDVFRWDIAGGLNPAPGVYTPSFDRRSDATAKQWTQELQWLGRAYDARLDWIVGLYGFREEGDQRLTDDIPLFGLRNLAPTFLAIETTSWAVFGQASWRFTDRVAATLGGRYTRDDKDFDASLQSGFGPPGTPPPRTAVSLERTYSSFTPKAGVDLRFTERVFGYVNVAKGFKAGGFNGLAVLNPAVLRTTFEPQEVWTYEAGLKAEWADRRVRTNLTAFWNDISGLQQTATLGAGSFAQQNVGDATVRGLEAELSAQPTTGLMLFANLGWQDDEYDRLIPGSQAAIAGGTHLPLVPELTAQVGFALAVPLGAVELKLGGDANHTGEHYLEVTNAIVVRAYTRYDAYVGVGAPDGRWEARLQGRNLSDEVNYVTGIANVASPALALLRPREWMLRVSFRL